MTANTTSAGTALTTGWNIIRFDVQNGIFVGSLLNNGNYVFNEVAFTITGASGRYVFNTLSYAVGSNLEIDYYSKFLFRNEITQAWSDVISSDTDIINLDDDALPMFVFLCKLYAARRQAGTDSAFDSAVDSQEYKDLLSVYKNSHRTEALPISQSYYKVQ